ncbi:BT4734/BF3469 family protein [uncultured Prevotella sp.]|uniref:BT4734/BF3469 family protein n=1 Tax=uncultured Prevotella sp. TaxID=159272 RepID=UPI00258B4B46|nr:BT4734/BF3469 family protein [uncultured Prevotella sp.]
MRSTIVGQTCAEIADCHEQMLRGEMSRENFETKKTELKKRLPAFCFHAHFKNGRRLNAEAIASGLSILDIDHIKGSPEVFFNEKVKDRAKELGIVLAHKTPSGEGLRLVFIIPQGKGLVEAQQWLSKQIGLETFDEACKDLARCSFAVPEEYVLFLDEEKLFGAIEPIESIEPIEAIEAIETIEPIETIDTTAPVPAKPLFVFDLCREQAGLKDVDINARGSRHNSLLAILSVGAARLLSEAEAMAVVEQRMPEFYKESDCRQLIHDFYAKYHDDSKIMSATVQRINARAEQLAQLSKEKKDKDEEEPEEPADTTPANPSDGETAIPPIPGLKQSLTGVPEKMRMPALCALLPMAAAYADDVTFRYCDGREQRLGLMSIVVGEQASGKSVCKDIIDLWRGPMDEDDEQGRRKEDEWKKKRKNRRANEKLDPEPEVLIRDVPITISCSTLLKRLKNAQGHTLYSFCSELDTLRKTNGAGSWSSKYDIYRLAFDHDEWGQDYNSDQAESGMVNVGYNWTILGTYGALGKCFKGENIENGLSSRVIVAEMPDSAFAPMPTFQDRKDRDAQAILSAVNTLRAKHGFVDTPRLRKAIAQWVENKRQQAMERIDRVMDTYRRRAAVIGMRCGVVACLLSGEKETKHVIDFALMMAEYVLQEQCRLFGDVLRKQYAADSDNTRKSKNRAVFDRLADTFTSHDILALKNDISESTARTIICRWKEAGWIDALPRHKGDKGMKYKKL